MEGEQLFCQSRTAQVCNLVGWFVDCSGMEQHATRCPQSIPQFVLFVDCSRMEQHATQCPQSFPEAKLTAGELQFRP